MTRAALLPAVLAAAVASGQTQVTPSGSPVATEALAICIRAAKAPAAARPDLLRRSVDLAERAVAENDQDPVAHFAVFCSLGRRLQGTGAGFGAVMTLRRAQRAIDRALALSPDYTDALAAKGAMLVALPTIMGGSPSEGVRLLQRALAADETNVEVRLHLARAFAAQGRAEQARAEAERALTLADPESAAEARALLAELGR